MTVSVELAPELEQTLRAKAAVRGLPPEDYLPLLVAQALRQHAWEEMAPEESLGRLTMLVAEPRLARIWDTQAEDEAWKHL